MGPISLVGVIWLYPLSHLAMRTPHEEAARDAAHVSLLFLELILPTVSTTVAQTLVGREERSDHTKHCCLSTLFYCTQVCERFDDGYFLSAQLTIPCNASSARKLWIAYAIAMLFVFPLGSNQCGKDRIIFI